MDQSVAFKDVIKKSLFEMDFTNSLSIGEIVGVLTLTFLMGMFIFYVYKKTFQGVLYTQSYNVSLVMVSLVTSLVIMTISSNFILSLGMVGALSIVRFRTAIKDSMDIVFMFWAISIGIANGAGFFKLSFAGLVVVSLALLLMTKLRGGSSPFLLIVNYKDADENGDKVYSHLKSNLDKFTIKSQSVSNGLSEMTIEFRMRDKQHNVVNSLSEFKFVTNATLVSYNGDYVS
jgi:uncharacterized membrane protein YhiD involved in acid resistance